jgi:hypothetical protein
MMKNHYSADNSDLFQVPMCFAYEPTQITCQEGTRSTHAWSWPYQIGLPLVVYFIFKNKGWVIESLMWEIIYNL